MVVFFKVLVILSLVILIVGMIKPKWIFFWMEKPDRLLVSTVALLLFMVAWTAIAKLTLTPQAKNVMENTRDRNELDLRQRR